MADSDAYALINTFNAAWNAGDLTAALALCTPDVVFESTDPAPDGRRFEGLDAVRECWRPVFETHGAHFDIEPGSACASRQEFGQEIFAARDEAGDDRVVQRWRFAWTGGHVRGADVITVRGGRIAAKYSYVKG
jgi:ketosteroid isomerase-like protein